MIRLSKSSITANEKTAVMRVLDDEYLGMGREVECFEKLLSDYFGRPAVCVANGTSALHLAMQALDLQLGDEVLVQSLTYIASFQAIAATGATAVACDIDPASCTLSWQDAEKRISGKTKAIMPMHYASDCGELDSIYSLADKHGLRVIEDAAHAFGSVYREKRIGAFGDVACFSFDGIKNITSGEGGCVVTDDEEVLRKVRDARLLGVVRDTEQRYVGKRSWGFDVTSQGWRSHMSNIMAAIGIEQFRRFPVMASCRQTLAKKYDEVLADKNGVILFDRDYDQIVPHIYVIQIEENIDRHAVRESLLESGIETGVHYQPNHELSFFINEAASPLPVTESIAPTLLTLPLHVDLSAKDIEYIGERVCEVLQKYI